MTNEHGPGIEALGDSGDIEDAGRASIVVNSTGTAFASGSDGFAVQGGINPELITGASAALATAGMVAKARISARADVRKAELEAQTRQLEITEETKRERMRLKAGQQATAPSEGD